MPQQRSSPPPNIGCSLLAPTWCHLEVSPPGLRQAGGEDTSHWWSGDVRSPHDWGEIRDQRLVEEVEVVEEDPQDVGLRAGRARELVDGDAGAGT